MSQEDRKDRADQVAIEGIGHIPQEAETEAEAFLLDTAIEKNKETILSDENVNEEADQNTDSTETEEGMSVPEKEQENPKKVPEDKLDYDRIAEQDLKVLKKEFPVLSGVSHIAQLDNAVRYGALRDMGLSPREAFLSTNYHRLQGALYDNRSHLRSAVPKSASGPVTMSAAELSAARELFGSLSDTELTSLYRRAAGFTKR